MYKRYENKGITLIALVITIIVLLILAGISLSMLSGNNSILVNATKARRDTAVGYVREEVRVAVNTAFTEYHSKVATKTLGESESLQSITDAALTNVKDNNANNSEVKVEYNGGVFTAQYKNDTSLSLKGTLSSDGIFTWEIE